MGGDADLRPAPPLHLHPDPDLHSPVPRSHCRFRASSDDGCDKSGDIVEPGVDVAGTEGIVAVGDSCGSDEGNDFGCEVNGRADQAETVLLVPP